MSDVDKVAFGSALRERRRAADLTQRQLAKLLTDAIQREVASASISAWEKGLYLPEDRATVEALETALGVEDRMLLRLAGYILDAPSKTTDLAEEVADLRSQVQRLERLLAELEGRTPRPPGGRGGSQRGAPSSW